MITTTEFWTQIGLYNQKTLPVQIVLAIAALAAICRVYARPGKTTDRLVKAFLAIAFAWNAIVTFLVFMRNPISTFTGVPLFLVVAILFVIDIKAERTAFRFPEAGWKRLLTALWLLLVFSYPLVGWALGHAYPQTCTPMMPCPLTVFALALVAAAAPRVDKKVYIALLPWALLGLPKALGAYDCYEDGILFAAGVYGLVELVRNWRAVPSRQPRPTVGRDREA